MSSITFSGLGSGMDYASWVEQLVAAKKTQTVTPLETKKTELENSKEALGIVKDYFTDFQTSLKAFTNITEYSSNDIFNQKTAKSSASDYLSVNCTPESVVSSYSVQIQQMATSTIMKSSLSSSEVMTTSTNYTDIKNATCGSFTIIVGNNSKSFDIEDDDTMSDIVMKINGLFSDEDPNPVQAEVTAEGKFKITTDTDESVILGTETDTSNFKSLMKLSGYELDPSGNKVFESRQPIYMVNTSGTIAGSGATAHLAGTINEGTISINGVEFEITDETTIDSLVKDINNNTEVGVNAYYDVNSGKLNLTSKSTGSVAIAIEDTDNTNFFNTMNLSYDGDSTFLGNDAIVSINGTTITSSSNNITNTGYNGLTLEILEEPDPDATIIVSVSNDSSSLKNAINEFIDSYNLCVSAIKEATASEGYLEYDSSLKTMYREMRSIVSAAYDNGSPFSLLAQIGISTGAAGLSATDSATQLVFDESKFDKALETCQMSDMKALFTHETTTIEGTVKDGSFDLLLKQVDNSLSDNGYFTAKDNTLSQMISIQEDRIERANQQLEAYEERLTKQFQAMDEAISALNSQYSSFLSSTSSTSSS